MIGEASAPLPAPQPPMDMGLYAARAGLLPGEAVTVVCSIEVLPDGTVGRVSIQSSPGNVAIEAQAIAYVHAMHWIPGTVHHRATPMQFQYAVTLMAPT